MMSEGFFYNYSAVIKFHISMCFSHDGPQAYLYILAFKHFWNFRSIFYSM